MVDPDYSDYYLYLTPIILTPIILADFDEGLDKYLLALHSYLQYRGEFMGLSASDFILEKIRVRTKEFNTILNISEEALK